jgi:hypothetical protein
MRKFIAYVLLVCSYLLLNVHGARKEQGAALQGSATALRRKGRLMLTQVNMKDENNGHITAHVKTGSEAKVSLWQDPYIPVHSTNAMTPTEPGHRPRAFVVAGVLVALMVMLFAAIFASIHRKVSEDLTAPVNSQAFGGLLGHSLSPVPVPRHGFHRTPATFATDGKTLRAETPGDLRRVEDEIAEVTADLTPPSSPESIQPVSPSEPEKEAGATAPLGSCVESVGGPSGSSALSPFTPTKAMCRKHLHPALGEAPLPTPPPRSPPKGYRRKPSKCVTDDNADQAVIPATPLKIDAVVVPPSDLRNLDDDSAELTRDLFPQSPSTHSDLTNQTCQAFTPQDFAEVKTLRAGCKGELRNHDDEFSELVQDLVPSSSRSSPLGELRSFQDEISELADDLHTQEHSVELETQLVIQV